MPDVLLLDSEGLSRMYRMDRQILRWVRAAREDGARVATTAMTTIEADYVKVHPARIAWTLSQIDVYDVTRDLSAAAAVLLRSCRLSGHSHAIDAVLAAVARSIAGTVAVVTSDYDDLTMLCGPGIEIVKV